MPGALDGEKMRIAIHAELDPPSRYGVVCHELAHILLGHLGTDADYWWPSRMNLDHKTVEIEAEATAYIVTSQERSEGFQRELCIASSWRGSGSKFRLHRSDRKGCLTDRRYGKWRP